MAMIREDNARIETAEMAFRRIARQKLIARGYAENQIEEKITELLRKGAKLRINVGAILKEK